MKTPTVILLFFTSLTLEAQQEECAVFLQQASKAIEKGSQKEFTTNLKCFSVAVERENVTSPNLNKIMTKRESGTKKSGIKETRESAKIMKT